jgi:RHS repeat-associated protein
VTSGASSVNLTYTIDAFGRTVSRSASGVTTTYRYAGEAETLVTETTGSTTTTYAHGPGGPLACKVGTAAAQVFIRDLHGDAVGRLATSATDMAAATWFSPWGEPVELESTPAVLGFQGQLTEHATGAVDMTTRHYPPELGRFTTRDVLFGKPRDPLSLNQYGYAQANPVTYDDPLGFCADYSGDGWCTTISNTGHGNSSPPSGGGGGQGCTPSECPGRYTGTATSETGTSASSSAPVGHDEDRAYAGDAARVARYLALRYPGQGQWWDPCVNPYLPCADPELDKLAEWVVKAWDAAIDPYARTVFGASIAGKMLRGSPQAWLRSLAGRYLSNWGRSGLRGIVRGAGRASAVAGAAVFAYDVHDKVRNDGNSLPRAATEAAVGWGGGAFGGVLGCAGGAAVASVPGCFAGALAGAIGFGEAGDAAGDAIADRYWGPD